MKIAVVRLLENNKISFIKAYLNKFITMKRSDNSTNTDIERFTNEIGK
jgi:hypothetical protein